MNQKKEVKVGALCFTCGMCGGHKAGCWISTLEQIDNKLDKVLSQLQKK